MKKSIFLVLVVFFASGHFLFAQCDIAENFDTYVNGEIPINWTVINNTNGTTSSGSVQSNPSAPSPSRFFRMFSGNATSGILELITPMNATTTDGNHRVTFFSQGTSDSSLLVGTTNTNDGSGVFNLVATISLNGTSSASWEAQEVTIPAGTDQYLVFRHSLGTTFDQVNIDSVCLQTIPTCLEVGNINLTTPTQTTIDLTWNESGSGEDNWEYVVQETGSGIPIGNGTPFTTTNPVPTTTAMGLMQNTEYEAYVRANCGGGDYGAWILSNNTIRTTCGEITENYCEDWDGIADNTVPFCWSVIDDPSSSGHAYVDMEFGIYQKNMFELFYNTNTVGDIIAISPLTTFATDGTHRLRLMAGASDETENLLEIGTIDSAGTFVQFTSLTLNSDRNTEYFVTLPNNGHSQFAFKHNGTPGKFIWINTFCIENIPSCLEVTDITVSDIQFDSATLSWNASGSNETTWEYLVQEAVLSAPDAVTTGVEVSTTTATVPLNQNTAYVAYVRSICGTDDFGAWIASSQFTTACNIETAEFSDSFEGLNENGQQVKPCWSVLDTTVGDFNTYALQNNILPSDGNLMLRMFFSSGSNSEGLFLSAPQVLDLNVDKQIRFKMNKSANTTGEFDIIVGTMLDPQDTTTFVALDNVTLNESTILAETWTEFTIDFTNYDTSLNHSYIAFKPQHSGNGSSFKYIYMDEFNYEFKPTLGLNDETLTAAVLTESIDYNCNNAIMGDFTGATHSNNYVCTVPLYDNYVDLWYRFTPSETKEYAFALETTGNEALAMFLYEGTSSNPEVISAGCETRYVIRPLNAGQTYFVSIASPEESTNFSLCAYALPDVPDNDEPAGAFELLESIDDTCNNAITGYTASSTHSMDAACPTSTNDVWYTFTPAETGEYTFRRRFLNGSATTGISVYEGTPGNLTALTDNCAEQRVLVNLIAGQQYFVAVVSASGSIPLYFTLCGYKSPPAPTNDVCDMPVELIVGESFEENQIIGTNTSATVDLSVTPLPICGTLEFETRSRDVWYSVTVPNSGSFVIETRFEDDSLLLNTNIETYTGDCGVDSLVPFTYEVNPGIFTHCSEQFVIGGNFFAGMRFTDKQPGQEVLIRVWGFASQFGDFKISAYDDTDMCEFPSNIQVTNVLETSATLSWDAPMDLPAGGYEYIVQQAGNGYPGAASGTATFDTQVILTNLDDNTAYEVYVKSICATNGSAWEGPISFTTNEILNTSNFSSNSFKMFPNPAEDILYITSDKVVDSIVAYNVLGQKVKYFIINGAQGQLDVSGLSNGLYLFEVQSKNERATIKVIVE